MAYDNYMYNKGEIRDLLKRLDWETADALENETLEFKPWDPDPSSLHRMLRENVVCLANSRGGSDLPQGFVQL
jgi:hypothetical protein